MKQEHSQLSHDAHECANSIPNLHEMVSAVKGLGKFCITTISQFVLVFLSCYIVIIIIITILQLRSVMILN